MPAKVKTKKKTKPKISSSHLQHELVDDLVEKIVNATDIEEKTRWSWGVIKEYESLELSKIAKKHVDKCQTCKNFLNSRMLLARLVIQGGRMQG